MTVICINMYKYLMHSVGSVQLHNIGTNNFETFEFVWDRGSLSNWELN